jgi:SAM-dependent methyltransferase
MPLAAGRVIASELLDHASPEDARRCLQDLQRINRYFGGFGILRKLVGEFAGREDGFSMLDVGAGAGDTAAALRGSFPRGVVVSLDRQAVHIAQAPAPRLVGDAFRLPFRPGSFDFVYCSLFLHHFTDDQVVALLADFRRVARRAVLAIDLERGPLAFRFLPATRWLFDWHRISVHDGQISVQAAFKRAELLDLARRAGLERARVSVHRPWARLSLSAPLT